jgi:hypothetical protein
MSEKTRQDQPVQSPPATRRAEESADDPRQALLALAAELRRWPSGRLLMEYLRLRRAQRGQA